MTYTEAVEVLKVLIDIFSIENDLDLNIIVKNKNRYKQAIEIVLGNLSTMADINKQQNKKLKDVSNKFLSKFDKIESEEKEKIVNE